MHLVLNTETSGFYSPLLSHEDPNQGRVIQLAALLLDEQLIDAHDALADCRGCAKLYKYLIDNNHVKIAA